MLSQFWSSDVSVTTKAFLPAFCSSESIVIFTQGESPTLDTIVNSLPVAGSRTLWFNVNVAPPEGCGDVCGSVFNSFSSQTAKMSFIIVWTPL